MERQSVLPQNGLPAPKCEEFLLSNGTRLRDVVHGVGVRKAILKDESDWLV